jgi:hypothetical protein
LGKECGDLLEFPILTGDLVIIMYVGKGTISDTETKLPLAKKVI